MLVEEFVCARDGCGRRFKRDPRRVTTNPCCTRRCLAVHRFEKGAEVDSLPIVSIGHCQECNRDCSDGDVRIGWRKGDPIVCVACCSDLGIPWAAWEAEPA